MFSNYLPNHLGIACLTSYRFSSTFLFEEKAHLKFLYFQTEKWECHDNQSVSGPAREHSFEEVGRRLLPRTRPALRREADCKTQGARDSPRSSIARDWRARSSDNRKRRVLASFGRKSRGHLRKGPKSIVESHRRRTLRRIRRQRQTART